MSTTRAPILPEEKRPSPSDDPPSAPPVPTQRAAEVPHDLQVLWPRELLDAPPEIAAQAFARSLHGYARRLEPETAKRFLMLADTPLNDAIDSCILAAYRGVHPKHWATDYHSFFTDRISSTDRVLDLGCGVCMVALSIIQRSGATVTGVDLSEHNLGIARDLAAARGLAASLTLVSGDIRTRRVPGTFDVLVLSNVLEHIADRSDHLRRWTAWYRPCRVLIRVPALDRDWRVPLKQSLGIDSRCDPTHETEYTLAQAEREATEAGLNVREIITRWGEYWIDASPE